MKEIMENAHNAVQLKTYTLIIYFLFQKAAPRK
ncbi:MAG: hypothetical protein RL610_301 [Pseudomonadota bacterium]